MQNSEESRADHNVERKFRRNLQSFDAAPKRSVVIRDLPFCCTSKDLQNFIAQHLGVPPSIAVVLRNPDGKTLQYGCALFDSEELATQAIGSVHLKRLHGRDIRVLPYSSASLREVSRSGDVLISFISLSAMVEPVTEQNIRSIVEEYGDIDYISIRQHKFSKEGIQNGFGFVTMASQEENQRVLDNVKGLEVENVLYTSEESNHVKKGVPKVVDDIHSEPSVVNPAESSISTSGLEANSAPVDISPSNSNFYKSPVTSNGSKKSSDMSGQQSSTNQSLKSSNSQSSRSNNNNNTNYRPNVKSNARDDGKSPLISFSYQTNQASYQSQHMNAQYVQQQHMPSTENTAVNSFTPQLMNYHPPRPYSPSPHISSGPTNLYISALGNNSSNNLPPVSNTPPPPPPLVTSPQLQAYPVTSIPQSQQYLPSAFSSVSIYPSGNQMARNNIHFSAMQPMQSIHQLHHPQFAGNINMAPVQSLPAQNSSTSSTNPGYQYPIVVDHSGTPTTSSYVNPYMPLPGSTVQQPHLPQQSPSAHFQQGQMPPSYVHISVAPNRINVPVASMVTIPPGQGPSSFPLTSSTSSNSSNPSFHHIQYSTPAYAHPMGGPSLMQHHHHHHPQQSPQQQQHSRQMQTVIYQQQPHQSTAFVSSTLSTSHPHSHNNQSPSQSTNQQHSFATHHIQHSSHLHSSQHDQQRR